MSALLIPDDEYACFGCDRPVTAEAEIVNGDRCCWRCVQRDAEREREPNVNATSAGEQIASGYTAMQERRR